MTVFDDALRTGFNIINDAAGSVVTFKGVQVKGDFGRGWVTIGDVQTYRTRFECLIADVAGVSIRNRSASPTANDTLTVNGIEHAIIEIEPNGNGSVILVLSRD